MIMLCLKAICVVVTIVLFVGMIAVGIRIAVEALDRQDTTGR